jgi:hypothetical protein
MELPGCFLKTGIVAAIAMISQIIHAYSMIPNN